MAGRGRARPRPRARARGSRRPPYPAARPRSTLFLLTGRPEIGYKIVMSVKGVPAMTKAYSYLRFSTPEQAQGDSFRRQTESAERYAAAHGLDLDDSLKFHDLGVSAFRGANAVDGALGEFIAAVDDGRVPRGSYLLVENLDRLSRDKIMAALNRFSALLEKGVTVVTLTDQKVYTAESLNNLPDLMLSLLVMSRAHDESAMKGQRLRAAWKAKKDRAATSGEVLTAIAPAWLRVVGNNGSKIFEIIEERAEVVRRIYAMALSGLGKNAIARRFNAEGVKPFGDSNGWYDGYIARILSNEAVIGRFQPRKVSFDSGKRQRVPDGPVIEDYFPRVVSDADFYRVKRGPAGISPKRKDGLPRNLLAGICVCGKCGGPMHYVNKGGTRHGGEYLACDNSRRLKKCDAPSVRYEHILSFVLNNLPEYLKAHVDSMPSARETDSKIDGIDGEIAKTEESIARLLDTLERVPSESAEKRLADHERRLRALKAERVDIEEQAKSRPSDAWAEFVTWYHQPVEPDQFGDVIGAEITRISTEIKRLVSRIVIEKGQPIVVEPRAA
ncbi:MAG: recombinase family protein [Alphaproteobacteria bacterium]|nr:recombinase family protein [Alphaproteobacteria bacterium]